MTMARSGGHEKLIRSWTYFHSLFIRDGGENLMTMPNDFGHEFTGPKRLYDFCFFTLWRWTQTKASARSFYVNAESFLRVGDKIK